MRLEGRRRSTNVEDRRGRRASRALPIGGGAALVVLLLSLVFGIDPSALSELTTGGEAEPSATTTPPGEDPATDLVYVTLASTEDVWSQLFAAEDARYPAPRLVLYDDAVESACGFNTAATGPFYCPGDQQVYLDLGFFREMERRLGAGGDFAQAYVIAHEVGHHVQRVTGTEAEVRRLQRGAREREANALSVRLELQADCFAGVWAHHADARQRLLEAGDVEEGLNAAAAIGDDRLQRMAGQRVVPDAFTHGSSAQRVEWFRRGLAAGRPDACDTFADLR